MVVKRIFSPGSYVIFPAAVVLMYWAEMYYQGSEFKIPIPGITTIVILAVMISLELTFRYDKSVSQKKLVLRDLSSTLINLWGTIPVVSAILAPVLFHIPEMLFGRSLLVGSYESLGPFWLQLILVILFFSLLKYAIHRMQHKVPFLWKLHSYHHTVTDLRASNAFVSHPLDFALRNVLPPFVVAIIGFSPTAIVFGVGLLSLTGTMSHCGSGLRAGWLSYLFVTPELHRWHHAAEVPKGHKFSVNYGFGFILWDRIFGTYYLPKDDGVVVQPGQLGHPERVGDESNFFKFLFLTRHLPGITNHSNR